MDEEVDAIELPKRQDNASTHKIKLNDLEDEEEESILHKRTFSESVGEKFKDQLPIHFGKKGGAENHHNLRKQKEE